jgi:hypothetical protein
MIKTGLCMRYALLLFIIFSLYGCASGPLASGPYIYVPKSVDANHPENYATIKTESEHNHFFFGGIDHRVVMTSLDGVGLFEMRWDTDYPEECYLTEGHHEVSILYRHMNTYASGCFSLYAETGTHYTVKTSVINNNIFRYWVETDSAGRVPMGQCKPTPK